MEALIIKPDVKKINYILLVINIAILILFLVYGAYIAISDFRLGKVLEFEITSNQIVDWKSINVDNEDNSFILLNESARNQLTTFMKNNNLEIKPGLYEFNQSDYFQ